MKKYLIVFIMFLGITSASAMTVEQFDREQAIYQQELYQKAREAGYDPTSTKNIAEQYKERRLKEQTIRRHKELQKEYEREYLRAEWFRKNGDVLLGVGLGICALLIVLIWSVYSNNRKSC